MDLALCERVGYRLRSGYRFLCRREGEKEGVPLRVHFDAVLRSARLPNDPSVRDKLLRVRLCAEIVQEPRRSLDIGEEEGDGAGREIASHAA